MSKAAQIRKLYAKGKTTSEIAKIVGCSVAYARVCARQRVLPGGQSIHDKRWRIKTYGSEKAYRAALNELTREYRSLYYKQRWREDTVYRARRQTYDANRKGHARA